MMELVQVLTVSQGEAEFKTKLSLVTAVVPLPDGQGYESQPLHVQLKELKHSKEKLYGGLTVDLAHFRTFLPVTKATRKPIFPVCFQGCTPWRCQARAVRGSPHGLVYRLWALQRLFTSPSRS